MTYILYDFGPGHNVAPEDAEDLGTSSSMPTLESATSSVAQSISIIIELVRKNNSDYYEPFIFHTVRNRLIQIQQHLHPQSEDGREELEHAMQEMVDRMGVVHFGPLLEIMCERMGDLQRLLRSPRSLVRLPLFSSYFHSARHRLVLFRRPSAKSLHLCWNGIGYASSLQNCCIVQTCRIGRPSTTNYTTNRVGCAAASLHLKVSRKSSPLTRQVIGNEGLLKR